MIYIYILLLLMFIFKGRKGVRNVNGYAAMDSNHMNRQWIFFNLCAAHELSLDKQCERSGGILCIHFTSNRIWVKSSWWPQRELSSIDHCGDKWFHFLLVRIQHERIKAIWDALLLFFSWVAVWRWPKNYIFMLFESSILGDS